MNTDHAGTKNSLRVHVVKRAQWPTPTAQDWSPTTEPRGPNTEGLWPTPAASASSWGQRVLYKQGGMPLGMAVAMWPTPTAQDSKNNAGPSQLKRNALPLNAAAGGSLNPDWVEALMGFPPGFTRLDPPPSATAGRTDSPESLPESPTE